MKLYTYLTPLTIVFLLGCAPSKKIIKQDYPTPFEFVLVDTLNADKNYIYVKSHEWISKTYGSAKTVIDMQDKEAGKIIGKALMTFATSGTPSMYGTPLAANEVRYIISIDVKEGKYRCVISDFYHTGPVNYGDLQKDKIMITGPSGGKIESKTYYDVKNKVMEQAKSLLTDLKEKMHRRGDDF